MYLKKVWVIVSLAMVLVFSLGAVEGQMGNSSNHTDVEAIYNSIRHSTPEYQWDESIVTFQNEGMTLVCTLTIPRTNKKCPIVISLVGFTGTRNGDPILGSDEKDFERLSRILAEQGFASLRVDYRGSGDSDGDYSMTTFSTQISDVLAAVEYIDSNLSRQVDSNSIGIIGFSQGGLVGSAAAAKDKRVDSLVLWSPVSHAPIVYDGLLTKEGIKQGLTLETGGSITLGIYVEGQYYWDVTLGKEFFEDLFNIDPIADIRNYKKPLMAICGHNDVIIWPQPAMSQLYLKYHNGSKKLVELDTDHSLNSWDGPLPEKFDDAIYWSTAWLIKTLNQKK